MKVKVCGLTRREDALFAAASGADYLGFIFAASPRRISPAKARKIIAGLPPTARCARCVGVFVNAEADFIRSVARDTGMQLIQLHGDESPAFCRGFDLPVIKALRLEDEGILDLIPAYETEIILLEPCVAGKYGGTGKQADWSLAARVVKSFPDRRFMLAGGLNPENVLSACRRVKPYALDLNSGLENAPGIKSPEKVKQLFEVVKSYETTG
jgi:phosphoribosylanthranilate isomerase